jgi:hypothetical protein
LPSCLGYICLIARDIVFDDLEELNGISTTTNRAFFYSFVPWLTGLANSSIVLPRTDEDLEHISALYRVVGLSGCAGSAGCLHFFWDMWPGAHLQSPCKGKDKFPSLVFEVVASHKKCDPKFGSFWSPIRYRKGQDNFQIR